MRIYKLKPEFREKIWGGHKFRDIYGMDCGNGLVGEGWLASSLPGKEDNLVIGTEMTLSELYNQHNELFGTHSTEVIPIKFLLADCNQSTSVQLHPNEKYAREIENCLGKPECVFFLDAEPKTIGMYGHNALNKEQFKKMALDGEWEKLLRKYPVEKGDFAYIPAGRIHTTWEGTVILELSRNADITYRVYDFDRVDANGNKRQLDLEKTLDVLICPDNENPFVQPQIASDGDAMIFKYHDIPGEFSAYKVVNNGIGYFGLNEFAYYFIADGSGHIDGTPIKKGETFFVPCKLGKLKLEGDFTILVGSYRDK